MNLVEQFENVLILCAHPDDELSMGGTVHRLTRIRPERVRIVYFSDCTESLPPGAWDIKAEVRDSAKNLGIKKKNIKFAGFEVRHFPHDRQVILDYLVKNVRSYWDEPDLVFLPSLTDIHQDHRVVAKEGVRAFPRSTILGFRAFNSEFNQITTAPCFVGLSPANVAAAVAAVGAYKSQHHRPYMDGKLFVQWMKVNGFRAFRSRIDEGFADAFDVIRLNL